ncbi:putative leader peptide [Geodermatophilus obscurus]|uniref:putative leader peptide n=1 Tax=Geodermatophilus obscurus TaxID=1861 RepID=UPI003C7ABF6B
MTQSRRPVDRQPARQGHGHPLDTGGGGAATVIPMSSVGIVRFALVARRHIDLLRCASALCTA